MRYLVLAAGFLLQLTIVAQADPQKFTSTETATKFCSAANVVWFNPDSKIYFPSGSPYYGKTKAGGYTCKALAEKDGYRAAK